jgi:hypothetical protein
MRNPGARRLTRIFFFRARRVATVTARTEDDGEELCRQLPADVGNRWFYYQGRDAGYKTDALRPIFLRGVAITEGDGTSATGWLLPGPSSIEIRSTPALFPCGSVFARPESLAVGV